MPRITARTFLLPLLVAFPAADGVVGRAQTLESALDDPALAGPLANEAASLIDGAGLPAGLWRVDPVEFQVGASSVASTLPGAARSRLSTSVQGPAIVSFRWRTQGGSNIADFFRFLVQGRGQIGSIRGNSTAWSEPTFQVDCGLRQIAWDFERIGSGNQNLGTAWLDGLVVDPIPNNPALQLAVEQFSHTLHSTDWMVGQLDEALNGNAAKSAPLEPGGSASLVFEVAGPASISFRWGIASDPEDGSVLEFYVDDSIIETIEGNGQLTQRFVDLGPGPHCLKFTYNRDFPPFNGGEDPVDPYNGPSEGYLDELVIQPYGPSPNLAAAVEREGGVYSQTWTRQTAVTRDGIDAAMATAPEADRWRRIYLEIPDGPGLLSFWSRLEGAEDGKGRLAVLLDNQLLLDRTGASDWTKTELNLEEGNGRVLQSLFLREAGDDAASTRAFLDLVGFVPGANNYQPDLSIAPRGKPLRGSGIVNRSGAGQTASVSARAGRPFGQFALGLRNGSPTDPDRISLRGAGSRRHFNVLFVVTEGGRRLNYSGAYFSGRFQSESLAPGASERHEIWVLRKRSAKPRSHLFTTTARSEEAASKVDVAKTRLRISR